MTDVCRHDFDPVTVTQTQEILINYVWTLFGVQLLTTCRLKLKTLKQQHLFSK